MFSWRSILQKHDFEQKIDVAFDVPMKALTTFKIGGAADAVVTVHDPSAFDELLRILAIDNTPFYFIGGGSNLLVSDEGLRGAVVRLSSKTAGVTRLDEMTLQADGGLPLPKLSREAQQLGLAGLAFACGIPGTVGGGVYMNAGAYGGEIKDVLKEATVFWPDQGVKTMSADELALSYRHSSLMKTGGIVLSATFILKPGDSDAIGAEMTDLLQRRRDKQPLEFPSAGSFFKRPEGYFAGKLIDDCGLRGYRVGDAQVSEKHAGFVINRGEATCEQVKQLEQDVRTRVYETFGVTMQPEVRLLGDHWLP
ncbi:MAG: UDP-N-acetylmuramate dehydrogenase [Clostridia bacterium]|nr:UDP-N-acetylmuramate dehydrogenase [Clostridia bacterium]